jgi:N-glycosylase/DNA lyase
LIYWFKILNNWSKTLYFNIKFFITHSIYRYSNIFIIKTKLFFDLPIPSSARVDLLYYYRATVTAITTAVRWIRTVTLVFWIAAIARIATVTGTGIAAVTWTGIAAVTRITAVANTWITTVACISWCVSVFICSSSNNGSTNYFLCN